ncbi:hypothetical protein NPX13_g9271 [Xylaria arbuscula]|uniref:RNase H type-1 domain-containing protein n=1 Tax=Xylaria arbuscula TaxID=114810 RepID=A0A9W8N7A5_9PEZI|nr:hypothetical protein NPX13_g9271 [Xylaria arbuscula]
MLRDPKVLEFDVIAVQEPWRNPFQATTHHPAKTQFHLCYPGDNEEGPARVCLFINKSINHLQWQFKEHTRDICTWIVTLANEQRIVLHNIYNPGQKAPNRQSALPLLRQILNEHSHEEQIVLGDFNLHHELWGGTNVRETDQEADDLISIMEDYGLTSTLSPGTVTYEEAGARTTIDLCLATIGLADRVIRSEIDRGLDHNSDHLPIVTILDLRVVQVIEVPKRNWKELDGEKFQLNLTQNLPKLCRPRTPTALEEYVCKVTTAIWEAADTAVPKRDFCNKSKEGWSSECKKVLTDAKRLRRIHTLHNTEETWEAYRAARNLKTRTIKKALQQIHRDKVEKAAESPESLWQIAKWARNRGNQAPNVTPELRHPTTGQKAIKAEEKAQLLRETFFPIPPDADLDDINNATYTDQIPMPPITTNEVECAIQATPPLKAPGPDGIPNLILKRALPHIKFHLTRIFNHSLTLGHCPEHFRKSTTVVLRKPGKDNYTVPKAYRPIALLNTIGKIMDVIIAKRISYMAETYQLLPNTHMGGRRLRSTEQALHIIVEKIYKAWNTGKGKVASLLLLDVSGAFDNVSHQRLLHNLRKRRIDERVVQWIESFLKERKTNILVDGYKSTQYEISTGIPQGSPLSPIDKRNEDTSATGYIDDAAILAIGDTTEETCNKLKRALESAGQWATTHASIFAPEKFQLTHFTRARKRINTEQVLQTPWGDIPPKPTCKYLGVAMDTKLTWKPHLEEIRRKVTRTIAAMSCLGNSTWGAGLDGMRKIYRGVAIPQMLYACSVWSNADIRGKGYTKKTLEMLQTMQARAARTITGAFKATSRPALNIESYLLPIQQQIWKHNAETIGRILSSQDMPELEKQKFETENKQKYTSPLKRIYQEVQRRREPTGLDQEIVPPYVTPPWWEGPTTRIGEDTEQAESEHQRELESGRNSILIYTDGSGIDGHIGAAAVCPMTKQTKRAYMGRDTVSTVYAGELQGISMALQIAQEDRQQGHQRDKVVIYTDNQAAIRSSAKPLGKSGAYLLKVIARRIQDLQEDGLPVEIRWIPAHRGILGNEEADQAAKEATGWRGDGTRGQKAEQPEELFSLKATLKTWNHKEAKRHWEVSWRIETKGRTTFRHTPKPTRKVLELHEDLNKQHSAILVQLRTEKIGLRDFLFKRKVPDITDPKCSCGERRQTVLHVLFQCRRFKDLRNQEFGCIPGRGNLRAVLSKRKTAIKAVKFIEQTQILGQFRIER